jgi:hypothetical protein
MSAAINTGVVNNLKQEIAMIEAGINTLQAKLDAAAKAAAEAQAAADKKAREDAAAAQAVATAEAIRIAVKNAFIDLKAGKNWPEQIAFSSGKFQKVVYHTPVAKPGEFVAQMQVPYYYSLDQGLATLLNQYAVGPGATATVSEYNQEVSPLFDYLFEHQDEIADAYGDYVDPINGEQPPPPTPPVAAKASIAPWLVAGALAIAMATGKK